MKKIKIYFIMFFIFFIGMLNVNAAKATITLDYFLIKSDRGTVYFRLTSFSGNEGIVYMKIRLIYDEKKFRCNQVITTVDTGVYVNTHFTCPYYGDTIVFNDRYLYEPNMVNPIKISKDRKDNIFYEVSFIPLVSSGSTTFKVEVLDARDRNGNFVNVYIPPLKIDLSRYNEGTNISTKTTTITKSSNSNLKKLNIENYDIEFDKNKTNYNITVANDITNLNIIAENEHSKASLKIVGNENLKVGTNLVEVIVTAENGSKKTYNINVKRNSNPNLKNLEIEGIDLDFNKDILDYKVSIPFEQNKINISAITEDDTSIYEIKNSDNIPEGISVIEIIVTAEDGITKTYNIEVNRMPEVKKEISRNKLIAIITISTLLIISFASYLFLKNKK